MFVEVVHFSVLFLSNSWFIWKVVRIRSHNVEQYASKFYDEMGENSTIGFGFFVFNTNLTFLYKMDIKGFKK